MFQRSDKHVFAGALVLLIGSAPASLAVIEDFSGVPAGTVVAGLAPDGSTVPGNTYFSDLTLSVTNNGTGPNSLVIFDSASPTGGDWDLGSPNNGCGGPGVGAGGEPGKPGENCVAAGHLMIIAANVTDVAPADGLVDQPNDDAGGGQIRFDFTNPITMNNVAFLDIDKGETVNIIFYNGVNLAGTKLVLGAGDNAAQQVDLALYGEVTRMDVEFSGSCSLVGLDYGGQATATKSSTWGGVKKEFR